ncbi:portal protein [Pseudothauera rhizosphaerae]|uniref:Portal protein n=1 Tax=Pseudothauera rhizosphaerae TaxID=2565932 RepID=A0A4S4AAI2_9RHOO|nr:hypothetical protein [Pseudothauera rhizosphaerae]THF55924.1 hypothetical protein E6O51_20270 [Pseudothauera rhizosphaerae]
MREAPPDVEQGGAPDWLGLARDAFGTSTSWFDASVRRDIEQDIRQFQGRHPAGSKYNAESYAGRSKLFRPKTRSSVRRNEAVAAEAFFSTDDVVTVMPFDDSNPIQRAGADLAQELLKWRLTKSVPWFMTACGAYQDAQVAGVVVSRQYWDYDPDRGIDRPVIELIPVENFRIDPGANWACPIETSPYLIQMIPMYVKNVRRRMDGPCRKTGTAAWKRADDGTLLAAATAYGDSTRLVREGNRQDPKDSASALTAYTIVWVHRNIVEHDGKDWLYYTLGTQHLLSDPVPLSDVSPIGRDYVLGVSVIETHRNYPGGSVRLGRDVQAEINDLANLRIDNIRFVLNKRYFVKRNKQVDLRSLTRNTPGSATLMDDPEKDVREVAFTDVTSSAYAEQDRLNLDFDDVTGAFSQASVQSNRNLNETVGGLNLLSSSANQVSGYQLRTFVETWVEPVLRQVLALEQAYETDEAILALSARRAKIVEQYGEAAFSMAFDLLDQDMFLNVNVGIGATNPVDQMQKFIGGMNALREMLADGVLERYGLDIEEVISEVFGKLGYRSGGRFFNLENEDPALTAAKQEIARLQQALDSKTPPELLAKQIEKLDAEIKKLQAAAEETGVKSQYSAVQTAQVIAANPSIAPVADVVLQNEGFRPDPTGIDPNLPVPAEPLMNEQDYISGAPGDTSPDTPAGPAVGALDGIETMEADGVA